MVDLRILSCGPSEFIKMVPCLVFRPAFFGLDIRNIDAYSHWKLTVKEQCKHVFNPRFGHPGHTAVVVPLTSVGAFDH